MKKIRAIFRKIGRFVSGPRSLDETRPLAPNDKIIYDFVTEALKETKPKYKNDHVITKYKNHTIDITPSDKAFAHWVGVIIGPIHIKIDGKVSLKISVQDSGFFALDVLIYKTIKEIHEKNHQKRKARLHRETDRLISELKEAIDTMPPKQDNSTI